MHITLLQKKAREGRIAALKTLEERMPRTAASAPVFTSTRTAKRFPSVDNVVVQLFEQSPALRAA